MILGASALGQFGLAGTGYEAAGAINYVDCAAEITGTSSITCAIAVTSEGFADIAAQIAITSAIQASIAITGGAVSYVNISATIAMASALTASLTAGAAMPDPGVSFTMTDKAGGA